MSNVVIKNRWSGQPIELPEDCPRGSIKAVLEWCARRAREGEASANLNGANLNRANLNGASLDGASLYGANLYGANLNGANLNGANLNRANLNRANLNGASLDGANLDGASLNGASLDGAKGLNKHITTSLYGLYLQVGAIRAFKLVKADGYGSYYSNGDPYEVGKSYEVDDADTDEAQQCARGLNVATLDWVCRGWKPGQRILLVEHKHADIAAIPIASDGKYRVHRLKVVRELDPADFGLGVENEDD